MEDDKLKSLFADFEPELPSHAEFMNQLHHNLATVDIIRQHAADSRSRNKKAVAIGLALGFIVGFMFSLLLPYLSDSVSNWQLTLPSESLLKTFANNFNPIAWVVIGTTSVLVALNTYEVSLSMMKTKKID